MPRDCDCAGGCGPQEVPQGGLSRRQFISLVGAGTASTLLAGPAWGKWVEEQGPDLTEWKKSLHGPSEPRKYLSDKHTDAKFLLGGIGTGNFELAADGRFTTWHLFNTLRDGYIPLFFGVRVGKVSKLLQTRGGPESLSRIKRIEMTGDYPIANLKFIDAELPVDLEMTAFSPFAPLDSKLSAIPAAIFVFKIHNPTEQKQIVSLGAMMQNPVGYDAMGVPVSFNSVGFNDVGERLSNKHPNFGGNVNEAVDVELKATKGRKVKASILKMSAIPGEDKLDKPLHIYTNANPAAQNLQPTLRPASLTVEGLDKIPAPNKVTKEAVIWLENAGPEVTETILKAAKEAVNAGATIVFSGKDQPLLKDYARITGGKPFEKGMLRADIVFDDFEDGYGKWKVEGAAFGTKPQTGNLPGQQKVEGFAGKAFVNSFVGGDDAQGKMTSNSFTVERGYIRFLVGGGNHPKVQIRLIVDGKTVKATTGKNSEKLEPAVWDVRDMVGKTAHIEIVDEQVGGWGHINVDQIEFVDLPGGASVMQLLDELLPARFSTFENGVSKDLQMVEGARMSQAPYPPTYIEKPLGAGRVVLTHEQLIEVKNAELFGERRRAYNLLNSIVKVGFVPGSGVPAKAPGFGTLALAVVGKTNSIQVDAVSWEDAWKLLQSDKRPKKPESVKRGPTPGGETMIAGASAQIDVESGKTVEIPFVLAWHYPNKYNRGTQMGNHYCEVWKDAESVAKEVISNLPAMREKTEQFRTAFYDSTLPHWLLDCITSQISTLRHAGVVFRIANGDVYGWEGSNGCCTPTCTHVWGYEQTLARLFPDLEKDMRRIDYKRQQKPDGGINNRTDLPSPPTPSGEHPFVDGHSSCVLKAYREAMNHPDDSWLKEYWPNIKKAVEYLVKRDSGGDSPHGLIEDDQWNTYDNAIHGVNSFIGSYYLVALTAGAALADRMSDSESAKRYREIAANGKENLMKRCWNGEYFQQDFPGYEKKSGEYGPGCLSDQLIGQWWAHQLGLGYLLPEENVKTALKNMFKYNWLTDFTNFKHNWRKFAGGNDKGLLICSWPKGGRPANTIPYVDEVWTGVEYQVAGHMIYEGMIDEAFAIIKGARDRYDGAPRSPMPRNPWNEIECGGHYARALANWSILLALSGFEYDGPAKSLRFAPRYTPENFKSFFTGPVGWGTLKQTRKGATQRNEIAVLDGAFAISELRLQTTGAPKRVHVNHGKAKMETIPGGVKLVFAEPVSIQARQTLSVVLG